ncbi:transglycosylase SLT domain-containing protein [Candidatus Woesearchaeota archaeon]|nr:transglycosylase SLT domain-containing protein [Candidatus Woesearchaeota archaeon]
MAGIRSRKGVVFMVILVAIIVPVIMFSLFVKMEIKKANVANKELGEMQFELLQTYQRGEKTLLYVDQSAKYSMHHAIYDLLESGGYAKSPCGEKQGYMLWKNLEKDCYPDRDSLAEQYPVFLNDHINFYAGAFPEKGIPFDNYEYQADIDDDIEVIGIAFQNIMLDVDVPGYEELESVPSEAEEMPEEPEPEPLPAPLPSEPSEYRVTGSQMQTLEEIGSRYGEIISRHIRYLNPRPSEALIVGMIMQESAGRPEAISSTGCAGLMQFCYGTATDFQYIFGDITRCDCSPCKCSLENDGRFDEEKSIQAGTKYMSQLLQQFAGYSDFERFATASYNGGSVTIKSAIEKTKERYGFADPSWDLVSDTLSYRDVPYFDDREQKIQKVEEIRNYVTRVMAYKQSYLGAGSGITGAAAVESMSQLGKPDDYAAVYAVRPSFRQSVSFDLPARFADYKSIALEVMGNVKECLYRGSGTADDDNDVETCAERAAAEVFGIDEDQQYYLLFRLTDQPPEDFLLDDDLNIRFGVLLEDDIPPPPVEGLQVYEGHNLSWDRNMASDVQFYKIYCSEDTPALLDEMTEVYPTYISKEQNHYQASHCGDISDDSKRLQDDRKYSFTVVAVDEAGNSALKGDIAKG